MTTNSKWTPQAVARLAELWESGIAVLEVAKAMGLSKYAVVGKAHRLGLTARPSPIKRDGDNAPAQPRQPPQCVRQAGYLPPLSAPATTPPPVQIAHAPRGGCVWPMWGHDQRYRDNPRFCDDVRDIGRPYCREHAAKAYVGNERV